MSVKVYNGWILKSKTLEEALSICKELRDRCLPKAQAGIAKEAATELAVTADLKANGVSDPEDKTDSLMDVRKAVNSAQKKVLGEGTRDTKWDFSFELALIPKGDDILVLSFSENDPGYEPAMKELGFEDYHYQNQVDKPKDISEEEWEQRHKDWHDSGYLQYEAPSTIGFVFTVINWNDVKHAIFNNELVESQFQKIDPDKRKRRVALELVSEELNAWAKETQPKMSEIMEKSREMVKERQKDVVLADKISVTS